MATVDTMKSAVVPIGDSSTELLAAVASGSTVVTMLQIGNVDGAAAATVSFSANKNGAGDVPFLTTLTVNPGEAKVVFSDSAGKLIIVDDGTPDTLDATASAAGDLVALISYIERVTT